VRNGVYMTWKEFKKRALAILNDDRSCFLEGEELEAWKQRQKEIAEINAEQERQEAELMAHWFEQDAYVNGNWFKRLLLRIQYILRDKHGEGNPPTIPDHIRMEIARCLLPDIIAFCESEQGKKEFEDWKKKHRNMNVDYEYYTTEKNRISNIKQNSQG